MTLSLFAYVGVLLLVHIDWPRALLGLIWPRHLGKSELLTVVAVLGTTISPYLFFWQSSQEAEEVATTDGEGPLIRRPLHVSKEFRRIGFDTWLGMAFSNFVALAIMLATAATLHANGKTDIATAADAAEALRPIAGPFASLLFAVGIIGTGLLAVPVLAGSAAFAFAESHGWKTGLEYKPHEAKRFYTVIVAATVLGVVLDWSNLDPIKALIYSAVLNGVVAVPIMGAMMIVGSSRKIMGHLHEHWDVIVVGWVATLVMAAASIGMFWDMLT